LVADIRNVLFNCTQSIWQRLEGAFHERALPYYVTRRLLCNAS